MKILTAKHPGTCANCDGEIHPGDRIRWQPPRRGRPRWIAHVDCERARLRDSLCTACSGRGAAWNNAPCRVCDGTGSRDVQDFAKAGGHPRKDP